MTIIQLFNQPFSKVEKQLPRMKKLGFTHILVSPPQKSHASRAWWGRYQPVDFTRIEGPLGNAHQLHSLCRKAHSLGLAIVADIVIHHLSNEGRYVQLRGDHIVAAQYPYFSRNDLRGVHRLGRGRGLPILNTDSPWVRSQLRNYLHGLYALGVRGFRIDSAKHMDPHLFPYLLHGLPDVLCFGELVYAAPGDFPEAYFQSMKAYDFPLARSLKTALAPGGDLGRLVQPDALWGPHSISFVNHHDMIKNRSGFAYFRTDDLRDRYLAYAYLLARPDGIPLVYAGDLRSKEVKAGTEFRRATAGQPTRWLEASRTTLAWQRGPWALAALNKGGHDWSVSASMEPGTYRDLVSGYRTATSRGRLHWTLRGRSAALLVKEA